MNEGSSHFGLYLKIPERAYDVAIGAVNDEVIPAQNNPIDIKYFEKLPRMGVSWFPKSTAFLISIGLIKLCIDADVIIIDNEIIPPIVIEITVSKIDFLWSSFLFHLFFETYEWRNRLYGTTVVPIRPIT